MIAFGAFVLLTWLFRAWYGRWIADDFCWEVASRRHGFWRAQEFLYLTLNGRFSVTFFLDAMARLGRWIEPYLAIGAMVLWLVSACRAARHAFAAAGAEASRIEEIAGGIAFVAAVVAAAPDRHLNRSQVVFRGEFADHATRSDA